MSSEPKNIMTMAELLRAAKLKRQQEEQEEQENTLPSPTIAPDTIVNSTVLPPTIVKSTISRPSVVRNTTGKATKKSATIPSDTIVQTVTVDSSKGYFPYLNDLSDRVIPELNLKPFEQVVLNRLYRLSRGWKSEECTVGLGALAKQCVMSKTSVQKSIGILVEKGLIEDLGVGKKGDKDGKRYRVLPGTTMPPRTILKDTIAEGEKTMVPDTTEVRGTIPPDTINKNSNKDLINTHSNTENVRVGSRFTIEECRKYAKHLQSTGQGINNPGGYATTIHRTGEADMLIESFLHPEEAPSPASNPDTSQCPDCHGSGFYYPKGIEGGVARCKHEQLRKEVEEGNPLVR
ncbi:MAG TPA: hypothetical protein VFQ47_08510 [Nitrososphaera sp.]|jgi:hypothetical protein|nr:hypothetical protein [Nitrososphaera sp.]